MHERGRHLHAQDRRAMRAYNGHIKRMGNAQAYAAYAQGRHVQGRIVPAYAHDKNPMEVFCLSSIYVALAQPTKESLKWQVGYTPP